MPDASPEPIEQRRKRLHYRAWHRGTKEMDLLLGPFADAEIGDMDTAALDSFETLLETPEPDLYAWIVRREAPDPGRRSALLERLIAFHHAGHRSVDTHA